MPNIKSAKKRVLVNAKKTEQNKSIRSEVKSEIKKVLNLIKENDLEGAKAALSSAFATIDSAASKNIIHDNNAANKKAKLSKKLDLAVKANEEAKAATPATTEEVKEEKVVEAVEEAPAPAKKTAAKKTSAKKATKTAE